MIDGLNLVGDFGLFHGFTLLLRGVGIGVNPIHEREEGIPDFVQSGRTAVRQTFFQALGEGLHGASEGYLEFHQAFQPAFIFNFVEVHRRNLEQGGPFFQGPGDLLGKFIAGEGSRFGGNLTEILDPGLVFPRQKGEEDFLLRFKIVVDGRPGKSRFHADILEGDVPEALALI